MEPCHSHIHTGGGAEGAMLEDGVERASSESGSSNTAESSSDAFEVDAVLISAMDLMNWWSINCRLTRFLLI